MKFFKDHKTPGVILVEVIFASAIVGFVGIAILSLQQTLLRATAQASVHLEQIRLLNNFIIETRKQALEDEKPPVNKKTEEAGTEFASQKKDATRFTLFKDFKGLSRTVYSVSWVGITGKREESLHYFHYDPPEDEKT